MNKRERPPEQRSFGLWPWATWRPSIVVYAAHAAYFGALLRLMSFRSGGALHFYLLDDELISMRFARHLAAGHGLVWNLTGPRIQGFTNPLWTLLMAATNILPIPRRLASIPVTIVGLSLLWLTAHFAYRLATEFVPDRGPARWAPQLLVLSFYPLTFWTASGTEVPALTCAVTAALWLVVRALRTDVRVPDVAWLLLGIATAVRLDSVVPAACIIGGLAVLWRPRWRDAVRGALWVAGFVAVQLCAQRLYFHAFLPNTYYLKVEGISSIARATAGLWVLRHAIRASLGWPMAVLPFVLFLIRPSRARVLVVATALAYVAYSVMVGGDAWEASISFNRFLCTTAPIVFSLAVVGLISFADLISTRAGVSLKYLTYGVAAATLLAPFSLNRFGREAGLRHWYLASLPEVAMFADRGEQLADDLAQSTKRDARVAMVTVGLVPFLLDRIYIDMLGKLDAHVAHGPVHRGLGRIPGDTLYPGHSKWDLAYSIGTLAPDVVVGPLWRDPTGEGARLLRARYIAYPLAPWTIYVRRGSTHVDRARLAALVLTSRAPMTHASPAR